MKAIYLGTLAASVVIFGALAWGQGNMPPMQRNGGYAGPERYPGVTTGAPALVSAREGAAIPAVPQRNGVNVAQNDLAANQSGVYRDRDDFLAQGTVADNLNPDVNAIVAQRQTMDRLGTGPLRDDTGRLIGVPPGMTAPIPGVTGEANPSVNAYVPPDNTGANTATPNVPGGIPDVAPPGMAPIDQLIPPSEQYLTPVQPNQPVPIQPNQPMGSFPNGVPPVYGTGLVGPATGFTNEVGQGFNVSGQVTGSDLRSTPGTTVGPAGTTGRYNSQGSNRGISVGGDQTGLGIGGTASGAGR